MDAALLNANVATLAAIVTRQFVAAAAPRPVPDIPDSRSASIADCETHWYSYWARELGYPWRLEGRLWAECVIAQSFYVHGLLRAGVSLLRMGSEGDRLESYLKTLGVATIATTAFGGGDSPSISAPVESSGAKDAAAHPAALDGCWSCHALDESASLGETKAALAASMEGLRPGGVAAHIVTVREAGSAGGFSHDEILSLADALTADGHVVRPVNFAKRHPLDGYVDMDSGGMGRGVSDSGIAKPRLRIWTGTAVQVSQALIIQRRA